MGPNLRQEFFTDTVPNLETMTHDLKNDRGEPLFWLISFYQDKEYVWSFVKNLKDSGIGIANDFPREIDKIHEKLYPVLKLAKKAKQKAYFKVDKLIINGQVYRGEETKHLVH